LGCKSHIVAVFAFLEPARMLQLLEGCLVGLQEPQKIHTFTMPQQEKTGYQRSPYQGRIGEKRINTILHHFRNRHARYASRENVRAKS
jgi:hypothetical protein